MESGHSRSKLDASTRRTILIEGENYVDYARWFETLRTLSESCVTKGTHLYLNHRVVDRPIVAS